MKRRINVCLSDVAFGLSRLVRVRVRSSVIGTSSKEKRKKRPTQRDEKPSTDEIQAMLMRDFAEGVMSQDYAKDESSESG